MRPVLASDVFGHERIRQLLQRVLAGGRLPPAMLFVGPEGVGKRTLALAAGRTLVCEDVEGRRNGACGTCHACRRSRRGLHPDLFEVKADGAVIKIDQVRTLVREINGRPFEASGRMFVVDDAHLMNEPAANALLKALEEPPPTSHIVLVSALPQGLLPTIRSRCQHVRFGGLPTSLVERHLLARGELDPGEARLRAVLACGSFGAALAFEAESYRTRRDDLLELLETVDGADALERMEAAERLAEAEDTLSVLTTLRSLLRDVAALSLGASIPALNVDVVPRLEALARGRLGARALRLAHEVGEARSALAANANKLIALDLLLDSLSGRSG